MLIYGSPVLSDELSMTEAFRLPEHPVEHAGYRPCAEGREKAPRTFRLDSASVLAGL